MIPLIDDFTHVGLACARLQDSPADRFAVVSLNCALGQDLDHTRVASFFFIAATLWILDRLFFRDRDWRRCLLWIFQPLLLIPFFWASQITTSMTAFWAAIWTTLLVDWVSESKKFTIFLIWSFLGATVRFEAFAYGVVFLGAYELLRIEGDWALNQSFAGLFDRTRIQKIGKGILAAGIAILFGKYALQLIPANKFIGSLTAIAGESAGEGVHYYPLITYPFLQFDSIARYLEAAFLPWRLSFYGDWFQWWQIDQQLWRGPLRLFMALIPIAGIAYWLWRDRSARFRWVGGIVFFITTSTTLSVLPRNDWYYPVRAYLGMLCLLLFITPLILRRRSIFFLALMISALSTAAHIYFHFSTEDRFRAYEVEVASGGHPFLDLDLAKAHRVIGQDTEALESLHDLYTKIPVASAQRSTRAATFWTLGLYNAWLIYDEQGRNDKAAEVYRVIAHSTYFPAIHACLQMESEPVSKCLEGDNKAHFCESLTMPFPKLPTRRPYRIDVEQVCGFKPLQSG